MAQFEPRHWKPQGSLTNLPRRDRQACNYSVYIPDRLAGREFVFRSNEAADVTDAEREIIRLDQQANVLVNTEALARLLLRAESVASSRIEGLEVGPRRLLHADIAKQLGEKSTDVTAAEVLANIEAMTFALSSVDEAKKISANLLFEAHLRLLAPTAIAHLGGIIRETQNWIGGSNYNPCSAAFVPPPPDIVESLLIDLCSFCNEDSLPAVAQAAIAHAQFETIHPFADGNGRVGRALIHMVLRRRGLTTVITPPVSLVLATLAKNYTEGLALTRYIGAPDSSQAHSGINRWTGIFASACRRAVADADTFEKRVADIQKGWTHRLGSARSDSAASLLIQKLPGAPVLTVKSAAKLIDRSIEATNEAIRRLSEAEILSPSKVGRQRNRVFEARDIIDAFTHLERQLTSPAGNTKVTPRIRKDEP
jgi:Fic family protein